MKFVFCICLLFHTAQMFAQCEIKIDTTYTYYVISGIEYIVEELSITNTSKQSYVTWLSSNAKGVKSNTDVIREFFLKRTGDFNFIEMFYEGLIDHNFISYDIFLKQIKPNERFKYFLLNSKLAEDTEICNSVVILPQSTIEATLNFELDENMFSPKDQIVVYH